MNLSQKNLSKFSTAPSDETDITQRPIQTQLDVQKTGWVSSARDPHSLGGIDKTLDTCFGVFD